MANYAEMYTQLFRAAARAIEILQEAQIAAEEIYISGDDPVITLLPPDGGENEDGGPG